MIRAVIVSKNSRLVTGPTPAKCQACPNKIRVGEAVFHIDLGDKVRVGVDDRLVIHVDCMRHRVDTAPVGRPVGDPKAQFARIKARLAAGDDLLDINTA